MISASDITRVGVVGAGTMGNGIAHVFALAGIQVDLVDVDEKALARALSTIEKNLARQVAKERVSQDDADATMGRLATATSLSELGAAEVIVEAATEHRDLKFSLFEQISDIAPAESVLATNTSSISITEIASHAVHPSRVIGMHFMNPVPVMRLVEVIRGLETSEATTDLTLRLCERLERVPVLANDFPGFVANRLLMPMINEAVVCVMEGVADAGRSIR